MNTERCSCGARDRAKCSKESLSEGGKMCVKELKAEAAMNKLTQQAQDLGMGYEDASRPE